MYKIIIFGGTTEGRILSERLLKYNLNITVSVATNEGKNALKNLDVKCLVNRLNLKETKLLLKSYDLVIDATHPYANEVTNNINKACSDLNLTYFRLVREESEFSNGIYLENFEAVVDFLNDVNGNVLLTTGSKNLNVFTKVKNFKDRVFVRVLPTVESIEKCYDLGFTSKNILAMQGPFSLDVNTSVINMVNAKYIVTKESGNIGGFNEKAKSANLTKSKLIVIGRPLKEKGYSLDKMEEMVLNYFNVNYKNQERYFPLFISLKDKSIKVFGGGEIATRRIKILLSFYPNIKVISPKVTNDLKELYSEGKIDIEFREYINGDCKNCDIVFALTNSREVNKSIYKECKSLKIYFNIGDKKEECSFYFPGTVIQNNLVIGVTASGENHRLVKETTKKIKNILSIKEVRGKLFSEKKNSSRKSRKSSCSNTDKNNYRFNKEK